MAWNLTPRNLSHLLGKTTAMSQAVPPSAPVLQTSTKRSPAALEREGTYDPCYLSPETGRKQGGD